ncbi:MAG: hypothetical protein QOG38_527 [Hyphomicrobiales bacterium]|jgi:hypothetical protein|nr:hypothetical protein [Hyphomicrobiales bacterium]
MGKSVVFAVVVVAAANALPGSARAQHYYPWCAWYDAWTYSCAFATREQCMATISGVGGICKPNPYSPSDQRARRRY